VLKKYIMIKGTAHLSTSARPAGTAGGGAVKKQTDDQPRIV